VTDGLGAGAGVTDGLGAGAGVTDGLGVGGVTDGLGVGGGSGGRGTATRADRLGDTAAGVTDGLGTGAGVADWPGVAGGGADRPGTGVGAPPAACASAVTPTTPPRTMTAPAAARAVRLMP
jgi:hypothetical protein